MRSIVWQANSDFHAMLSGRVVSVILLLGAALSGGCSSGPPEPSYQSTLKRPMELVRVDRGEIIAVHDVMINLSQARRVIGSSGPSSTNLPGAAAPAPRRTGIAIPLSPGPGMVPGEELTVRLADGRMLLIVQERASPAMAKTERVRVITEKPQSGLGEQSTRVEREQ
jgi:outer membrane lipoprotein SlyB